jgi:hypothetical protein
LSISSLTILAIRLSSLKQHVSIMLMLMGRYTYLFVQDPVPQGLHDKAGPILEIQLFQPATNTSLISSDDVTYIITRAQLSDGRDIGHFINLCVNTLSLIGPSSHLNTCGQKNKITCIL